MALYRKYRPATFAEVVGQEHVTDPLSIALDTGRISHAYLFSGPRGCGKTSSARILARSLNCVQGPTSKPCGVCSSCVALGPGGPGNLDVIELDAASHGGVDDTRELRDRAFYAPAESRYRVFIVDEAHMVTTAGFNALLKIVEEPPAHLIFVFATTEPDKVLPTIRSRTHHYPFRLLPPATMRGLLGKICDQENVQVEESVYPLVIRAGGGSPRDSLSVLDQLLAGAGPEGVTYPRAVSLLGVTDIALIDDAVEALATSDGAALFGTIDRVVEAGHDPRRFATDLLERLRDLILLRAVPDATERNLVTGPGDVLDRMRAQANNIGPATLARHAELLHEGLGDMRGATNPRLLLEVIAARMLLPSASEAESATLQRLETIERRMANGIPAAAAAAPGGSAAPARAAGPAAEQGSASADASAPSAPPASGNRRRGAEALAALRAEKDGTPTPPAGSQPTGAQVPPAAQAAPIAPQQPAAAQQRAAQDVPAPVPPAATSQSPVSAAPAPTMRSAPATAPGDQGSTPAQAARPQAAAPEAAGQPAVTAIRPPELSPVSIAAVQAAEAVGAQHDSTTGATDSGAAATGRPDSGMAASAGAVTAPQAAHPAERAAAVQDSGNIRADSDSGAAVPPDAAGGPSSSAPHPAEPHAAADAVVPQSDSASDAPTAATAGADRSAETAVAQKSSEPLPQPGLIGLEEPSTAAAPATPGAALSAVGEAAQSAASQSAPVAPDSVSPAVGDAVHPATSQSAPVAPDSVSPAVGDAVHPATSQSGPVAPGNVSPAVDGAAQSAASQSALAESAGADPAAPEIVAGVPSAAPAAAAGNSGLNAEPVAAQPDSKPVRATAEWGAPVGKAPAAGTAADSESEEPAAGAEPVAAAQSGDAVLQEIEAAWADIRAKVREFGAAVQALLSGASVARVEGATIVFAHQHAPLAQRLSQPKNLEAVRSAVKAVLGRDHDVKWEVGGAGSAPAARGGSTAPGGRGPATKEAEKKAAPKFSRPSQAKGAAAAAPAPEAPTGWGNAPAAAPAAPAAPVQAPAGTGSGGSGQGASAPQVTPYEDDIPLPDGPDLPDDPGAVDYPPVGYDGVPPATTEEEEREMLEDAAKPVPAGERRDPDDVALELLRAELGATPLEG